MTYLYGHQSEDILTLQRALVAHGFDVGPEGPDSGFGDLTLAAVRNAQTAFKLYPADGLVRDDLLLALGIEKPKPVSGPSIFDEIRAAFTVLNLIKETKMDSTKPWYTSQTIIASGLSIIGIGLTYFHVGFSAADQATVTSDIIQLVTVGTSLWAIVGRLFASKKIG